jgi:hypothetical protein
MQVVQPQQHAHTAAWLCVKNVAVLVCDQCVLLGVQLWIHLGPVTIRDV